MVHGWISVKTMRPVPGKYVDLTDGDDTDVGFYEGDGKWYLCIGSIDIMNIMAWKPRPQPPNYRPEIKKPCEWIPGTELGSFEGIVLYFKNKDKNPDGFHVTFEQYNKLVGGNGKIYGRTRWGPFCELWVYDYYIITNNIIRDEKRLKQIAEELSQ